jgi:transcriptional regulator with XRE-family HTH domain
MELTIPKQIWYGKHEKGLVEQNCLGAHNLRMPKTTKIRPEDVSAIAQRLRALRATTKLSQEAFAKRVGLGYKQWGNFEAATGRIGLDAAMTLTRELKVPLDWIYLGEEAWLPAGLRDEIRRELATLQAEQKPQPAPERSVRKITRAS